MNVVKLGQPNLRDVVESLRMLADKMEKGEVPAAVHAIVVAETQDGAIYTFGYGDVGDMKSEVGLLHVASIKMTINAEQQEHSA